MQTKSKIKNIIKKFFYKKGLKTNRQIIVFESDDWGAERSFSKNNLNELQNKFPDFNPDNYQQFDCLETDDDVDSLKQTLLKHKDKFGNPACFTLNFATANLDYSAIKKDNYKNLKLVTIDNYYKSSSNSKNALSLVKEGMGKNCFLPQLHAREHINSEVLLKDIQTDKLTKTAFDLKIVGVKKSTYCGMDCLNTTNENSAKILTEAVQNFKNLFGFSSESFIAPCYVWKDNDEKVLESLGVKYLQGKLFQNIPIDSENYKKKIHKFGQKSKVSNLTYFYRNCFFEPSKDNLLGKTDEQILEDIISQIKFAFKCKKPAVICCHRVNFAGGINCKNRIKNIELLDKLLTKIEQTFPNVEYMSTPTMCKEILK